MTFDLDTFVLVAYAGTILAAVFAEFWPRRDVARRAGLIALLLAVTGGVAWGYAVIKRGYIFSPGEKLTASRSGGEGTITLFEGGSRGGGTSVILERDGGGGLDIGREREGVAGGSGFWNSKVVTGSLGGEGGGSSLRALLLGTPPAQSSAKELDGDIARDCEDCSEMLVIAGGSSLIGAAETDTQATSAELPQRVVRLWPGFAISRKPVTADQFKAAKLALGLPEHDCGMAPAIMPADAVCLSAEDAQAYADWLTRRTGKRFRLPTAIEWEFAARQRGTVVVAALGEDKSAPPAAPLAGIGQYLSEMTSDCYDPYLPSEGRERYVWATPPHLCAERVLKGAGLGEDPSYARFSARRAWDASAPRWSVGFRVVRDRS